MVGHSENTWRKPQCLKANLSFRGNVPFGHACFEQFWICLQETADIRYHFVDAGEILVLAGQILIGSHEGPFSEAEVPCF